ncbi:MAG: aldehyde dehydrogenase family protein [Gemmatimonadales bacterium]
MSAPAAVTPVNHAHRGELDAAVEELRGRRSAWLAVSVPARIGILDELIRGVHAASGRWIAACLAEEGLDPSTPTSAEEILVGPYLTLRNLRLLRRSLMDIERRGVPRIPGGVRDLPDGRVSAQVMPADRFDRLMYLGATAEVWMQPGVTREELPETQALAYRSPDDGGVCLVLGAGNVSSIAPLDAVYKLFIHNRVVIIKTHPTLAFMGPIIEEAFGALIRAGFLRIVHGGAPEGAHLVHHPGVDELHITGSDRTYEAIVFGSGTDGRARKQGDEPIVTKPFTAELGNITPIIVVPGRWSDREIAVQADNVASMLTNNAGFNCTAARVIITPAGWRLRQTFLGAVRRRLATTPVRSAFYPGAEERFDAFVAAHPEAELYGERTDERLPWALISDLDPGRREEICFTTEAFCSVVGEAPITSSSVPNYLERAVGFANDVLWGTLNATLLVDPRSARDREVAAAVDRAVADLRYGTVGVNHWSGIGYALGVTPWGAYPGHHRTDIGSGTGVVHNTLMFSRSEKTVIRGPFRPRPKPIWFASHRNAHRVARQMVAFERSPSLLRVAAMLPLAMRG